MEDSNNIKFRLVSIANEKTTTISEGIDLSSISEESLQFQYKIGTVIKLAENTITVVPSIRYMFEGLSFLNPLRSLIIPFFLSMQ